jgi:hypothetical protein
MQSENISTIIRNTKSKKKNTGVIFYQLVDGVITEETYEC